MDKQNCRHKHFQIVDTLPTVIGIDMLSYFTYELAQVPNGRNQSYYKNPKKIVTAAAIGQKTFARNRLMNTTSAISACSKSAFPVNDDGAN